MYSILAFHSEVLHLSVSLVFNLFFPPSCSWLLGRRPEYTDPKVVAQGEGREGLCAFISLYLSNIDNSNLLGVAVRTATPLTRCIEDESLGDF